MSFVNQISDRFEGGGYDIDVEDRCFSSFVMNFVIFFVNSDLHFISVFTLVDFICLFPRFDDEMIRLVKKSKVFFVMYFSSSARCSGLHNLRALSYKLIINTDFIF